MELSISFRFYGEEGILFGKDRNSWRMGFCLMKVFQEWFYSALSWLKCLNFWPTSWVIKNLLICIDLILSLWSEAPSSVKNSNILIESVIYKNTEMFSFTIKVVICILRQ